ncbi:uroporphyrinogen-III C-methyltransferase [Comamonas serinivorans]|uniref:uroporphyrinogen-III C-methyltransferase n=1 Tax=Comamonas serinivorans TaxID=1082851 RepID=A0A1Y0EN75_9BURK|nr:uroporphyrinogen-III C-methyltransferase [Comamonas serinivorans]ARU05046.1 uroporphyrinogen-III C-methyltransferase [Comamonas serinivorans]
MSDVKVWLVGAGPGDPELLTLKAVRVLGQADVVLVDDLVNPAVLAHCPQARLVPVGKRGGCRSTPQAFIQRLMLRHARQGLRVVRLKGGDPGVFGRSGEEVAWLQAHGVACEVVNGITAGLAAATACGLPLTMRGITQGVTLVTGHTEHGDAPNWAALVAGGTTLLIYMGVAKLADIQAALLGAGMAADMPVALVEQASLPQQRQCQTTLSQLRDAARRFALRSPAILVVGRVVSLAQAEVLPEAEVAGHRTRAA